MAGCKRYRQEYTGKELTRETRNPRGHRLYLIPPGAIFDALRCNKERTTLRCARGDAMRPVVIWWSAPLDRISSPLQMRSAGRKPTIGFAHLGRNLCPSLFKHPVDCLSVGFLVEYATLASRECTRSGPSITFLPTWFQKSVDCIAMVASTPKC